MLKIDERTPFRNSELSNIFDARNFKILISRFLGPPLEPPTDPLILACTLSPPINPVAIARLLLPDDSAGSAAP